MLNLSLLFEKTRSFYAIRNRFSTITIHALYNNPLSVHYVLGTGFHLIFCQKIYCGQGRDLSFPGRF